MTNFFTFIANILFPIKHLLLLFSVVTAGLMMYMLLFSPLAVQDKYLQPCLLVLLWSLLLRVLSISFKGQNHNSIGDQAHNDTNQKTSLSFFARWKSKWLAKIKSLMLFIYSLAFLLLVLATCYFSFKFIKLSF